MAATLQSTRVSVLQLEKLLDFLESHEDLALGHCRSKEGRQTNKRLWEEVSGILNSIGDGAIKDGVGWSKYWTIFKNRLKTKIRNDHAARRQTGGGPHFVVYTTLEERARSIIGSDAGTPLSGVQLDPFETQESGAIQILPEDQENIDMIFESEVTDSNEDIILHVQDDEHSEPVPGPSTAPMPPPPPPTESDRPAVSTRSIRRQRTRSRMHSLSEARTDIVRLENARVAAEASTAEALQELSTSLLAIATAISGLTSVLGREHRQM